MEQLDVVVDGGGQLDEFFSQAPREARWGTVTPQYMMGTADAMSA
jgi:hypothetical protein